MDTMDANAAAGIDALPNEILLDILSPVCNIPAAYLSHLLINRRFYALVKYDMLRHIPIRINSQTMRPFFEFVTTLGMGPYVRYLWINNYSSMCSLAVQACHNLVALACSKVVIYSLCPPLPYDESFRHNHLKELTLFDSWDDWIDSYHISRDSDAYARDLLRQITHLRLHSILSAFPAHMFPSVTHCSFSSQSCQHMQQQLGPVFTLPNVESIVITTYFWKDEPADDKTSNLLAMDKRIRLVFSGPNEPGEYTLWCGRARNTVCLWTATPRLRRIQ